MPGSVANPNRQQDCADTFRNMSEQKPADGNQHDEHEQLAKLDTEIECEQRCNQVAACKLQVLAQAKSKAKAMHEAERKGQYPTSREAAAQCAFDRHVEN